MVKKFLIARDVEEYFFCPMVFYFVVALGQERFKGYWSDVGKEVEAEAEKEIAKRFKIVAKGYEVQSERLCVRGKIDYLVEDVDALVPVEVKYSAKVRSWWKYSLALYCILLEDTINKPVKHGYLYLSEKKEFVKIYITDYIRNYVEDCVTKCHEIVEKHYVPKPRKMLSCKNCDFRDICKSF